MQVQNDREAERHESAAGPEQAAPAQPDDELIRRGLRGDLDALDALFARHNRALYQTALRLLGNREDAEDALQEGYLSAYRNLRRFEGRSQFSTWLTRIVINAALMRRRSQRARPAASLDEPPREEELPLAERFADEALNPEQAYEQTEIREMVHDNLGELSPLLRSAFLLREVRGFSTQEAAKELGVSQNTLKARLWRARHLLADRLGRHLRRKTAEKNGTRHAGCGFGLGSVPCTCCAD